MYWLIGVGVIVVVGIGCAIRGKVRRRVAPSAVEKVAQFLSSVSSLRDGLTGAAADTLALQLVERYQLPGAAIHNEFGENLSWQGDLVAHHFEDIRDTISSVAHTHQAELIGHDVLPSCDRVRCPFKYAAIVPLMTKDTLHGVLVTVHESGTSRNSMNIALAVADLVQPHLWASVVTDLTHRTAVAEAKAMRSQISPHFLFNALNTIKALVRSDPEQAQLVLDAFAGYVQHTFEQTSMFSTIGQELAAIESYLAVEKARFGARLTVRLAVSPEVVSVRIPAFVIQPLVENAIKHGLSAKPGGGTITIRAYDQGAEAIISVDDDGAGADAETLEARVASSEHVDGSHVGIGNVVARIQQFYGPNRVSADTAPGAGMCVTMRIPKFAGATG
jgi:two-component system LytT family sensor kinase